MLFYLVKFFSFIEQESGSIKGLFSDWASWEFFRMDLLLRRELNKRSINDYDNEDEAKYDRRDRRREI